MHSWNLSPADAIVLQQALRQQVCIEPLNKKIKYIAGGDVSLNMFEKDIYAGVIVLAYPSMKIVEYAVVKDRTDFPYIPGLLSFREIPALIKCWEKLSVKPDVVMVDGQGIAHPRRLGIAAHLGVLIDVPTLGCGKSRLYGIYETPTDVGTHTNIIDPKNGEVIGAALKSKVRSNPLIISPGHKMDVTDALTIVKHCLKGYRLPEPTRQAHILVNAFRKGEIVDNK